MKRNIVALNNENEDSSAHPKIKFSNISSIKDEGSFENKLVLLFSGLDQELFSLKEKVKKQPYSSISILLLMINECAEFTEQVMNVEPESSFLTHLSSIASEKHSHLKLLHVRQNRLSDSTALNLYKGWKGEPSERHQVFQEISLGMAEILNSYLYFFSSSLGSSEASKEWDEICDVFTDDLDKTLQSISF